MITFPDNLTPVPKFPGYFWDVVTHKLYSIKVAGELRELTVHKANRFNTNQWNGMRKGQLHYVLSKEGRRHITTIAALKKLKIVDHELPLINKERT